MAREFAKAFYRSKAWKNVRQYVFTRDKGLCQDCLKNGIYTAGKEVHHITWLTPDNINNPSITLNENNLILLCKDCHHNRHDRYKPKIREGLVFNEYGELVEDVTIKDYICSKYLK